MNTLDLPTQPYHPEFSNYGDGIGTEFSACSEMFHSMFSAFQPWTWALGGRLFRVFSIWIVLVFSSGGSKIWTMIPDGTRYLGVYLYKDGRFALMAVNLQAFRNYNTNTLLYSPMSKL